MSLWSFDGLATWAMLLGLAGHLAAGIGVGIFYFQAVWWNAHFLALGGRATIAIALVIGRFVLLGGLLALASLEGALPLLMMALGILVARSAVLHRAREAVP